MKNSTNLLVVLAICALIAGVSTVSQATLGVFLAATAVLLGVFARMAQAEAHHREAMGEPRKPDATPRFSEERPDDPC